MLLLSDLFNPIEENCVNVVCRFRDVYKWKITTNAINEKLKTHPSYPSLLSISDALHEWKIENISIKTTIDKLRGLPLPLIVQIQLDNKYFVVVRKVGGDTIEYSDIGSRKWNEIKIKEFEKQWTGIVMLADPSDGAGEAGYKENRRSNLVRTGITLFAIFFIVGFCLLSGFSSLIQRGNEAALPVTFLLLKLLGSYFGILLLWHEIDAQNPIFQKICQSGTMTNCNKILQSNASRIAGVSWSEIGFVYFSGGLLFLLFSGLSYTSTFLISWLSILALPYVFFSIYYQWMVARQWCVLCLSVQGILLAELIISLSGKTYDLRYITAITNGDLSTLAITFIAPALGWYSLKPLILISKESEKNKIDVARLKNDPRIFEALLAKQKRITSDPSGLGIYLGSPLAKNKIIKVCNPYCRPCSEAHSSIEELLAINPDLQVQIIFTATNVLGDPKSAPVRHFLALADKNDKQLLGQALDDWYNAPVKDYERFSDKYRLNEETQSQDDKIGAMHEWCVKEGISFTPTIFFDGFQLPEMYSLNDLRAFLS